MRCASDSPASIDFIRPPAVCNETSRPALIPFTSHDRSVPPFTIEKGTYPFVDHDIETVTLGAHLVALEKTPPEVVRALLTAITDNADQIASVHPSMKRLDTKQ